jgi:hypothetical protein
LLVTVYVTQEQGVGDGVGAGPDIVGVIDIVGVTDGVTDGAGSDKLGVIDIVGVTDGVIDGVTDILGVTDGVGDGSTQLTSKSISNDKLKIASLSGSGFKLQFDEIDNLLFSKSIT